MTSESKLIAYIFNEGITEAERNKAIEEFSKISDSMDFHFKEIKFEHEKVVSDCFLLVCFSDSDVLRLPREIGDIPPIMIIELPGDNSFFSQISILEVQNAFQKIETKNYELDSRALLKITFKNLTYYALNDLFITSTLPNTRIRYDFIIDNQSVFEAADSANGILLSTPTGSTAMAMNLGGILIQPDAKVFQLISVASRNFLGRQRIISDESNIEIEILDANFPLLVQIDNEKISSDSKEYYISKTDKKIQFIKFQDENEQTIQRKLMNKISFEDTEGLTSSAKFMLHVLQQEDRGLTVSELSNITHIQNQKTLRNGLKLLIEKKFVRRKDNLEDLREHLYYFISPELSKFYD